MKEIIINTNSGGEFYQGMIKYSKKAYLLCAKDKFGKSYFHNLCHKDEISGVIHE